MRPQAPSNNSCTAPAQWNASNACTLSLTLEGPTSTSVALSICEQAASGGVAAVVSGEGGLGSLADGTAFAVGLGWEVVTYLQRHHGRLQGRIALVEQRRGDR
jgi:hypothetical protein